MAHKRVYDTTQRNFRFVQDTIGSWIFNVYQVRTNLRVGILDASDVTFRFTDPDKTFTEREVRELFESAKIIHPDYID